uniref:BED-type domain-containing protein n=1 Tax=Gadus morhua TaxID=8049 RepID=A0A8C5BHX1_GADMO
MEAEDNVDKLQIAVDFCYRAVCDIPQTYQDTIKIADSWRYAHYFELQSEKDKKNIVVKCNLCVGGKLLSTAKNSTSNLKKHLSSKHPSTKLVGRPAEGMEDSGGALAAKQQRLSFSASSAVAKTVSASEIHKLVAGYVVEEMLPISTVESPSFRRIINKIPTTSKTGGAMPDRKTFANYLDKCYGDMEKELREQFDSLEYISTTADLRTANNKSFMGMTAHWIQPSTLKRGKAAIACRRVRGRHTYDVIAGEIEQIHMSYGLGGKVTATVTDNGSNFVKAFQVFHKTASDSEEEDEDRSDSVTFEDLNNVLSGSDGDANDMISLPPHHRCASHTLNLISTDIEKWLSSNSDTRAVYRSATAKCSALWTKASRSAVASETVEKFSRRKLLVPTSTRWNSFYEALCRITDITITDLQSLCTQLGMRCITDKEYHFVKEYCIVVKPLAMALDILQGEDNCFYGTTLPTLEALMTKTLDLKANLSRMTSGLPDAIKTRFASTLDSKEALLAAVTIPKFKLRWLRDDEAKKDAAKCMLAAECHAQGHPLPEELPPAPVSGGEDESNFFSFTDDKEDSNSVETEIADYLKSGVEIDTLNKFPTIKALFLRFNTPTPSSANRLSDKRFEHLLLLLELNFQF